MDETIYGKCGYLSVKWEFRKFENGRQNPLLTEKTLHLYGNPRFHLKLIRCLRLLGWRLFTEEIKNINLDRLEHENDTRNRFKVNCVNKSSPHA